MQLLGSAMVGGAHIKWLARPLPPVTAYQSHLSLQDKGTHRPGEGWGVFAYLPVIVSHSAATEPESGVPAGGVGGGPVQGEGVLKPSTGNWVPEGWGGLGFNASPHLGPAHSPVSHSLA